MHDVVIVGAGPVGLLLAGELGLAGCSVLVLEEEQGPRGPWRRAPLGMRGMSAASVEAFYRRGMLDGLLATAGTHRSIGADGAQLPGPRGVVHFAGIPLDPTAIDLDAVPLRLPSPALESTIVDLGEVESLLAERASALGVEIRRGVTVTGVTQHDGAVVAHAGQRQHPARWLVGCDGGHSVVRGLAGFAFVGTEPLFTGYLMLASVPDVEKLRPGFNLTPQGMYLRASADGRLGLMDFDGGAFDRAHPPTREHLQEVLHRVSGTDVTLDEVRSVTTFTDRAMQATTYRHGRVLLAGDAAHIHSPLGGQGLNLGLGDAVNLGWKLAATVRGTAPEGLLDTYTRERHPVGARILDWTRAQVAVMRPGSHAAALQSVVRDLLHTTDGTAYVFNQISGASIRYDLGDGHSLVGRSTPEFRLQDGTCVSQLLRDGHGIVLDFTPDHRLRVPAHGWHDRLRHVPGPARDDLGLAAVLIRPDGVVAWAGDHPDRDAFEAAARRWFGAPNA